ncbi:ABC transporter ATP-binding protein/permease [Myxococcota bacterium]|nr:ABC transporter ATP-binding protein/permease [Myxococcota bacterium]
MSAEVESHEARLARRKARQEKRELSADVSFGQVYDARILKRLWAFVRPHKKLLALAMASYPITSALNFAQPYVVKLAVDEHLVPKQLEGFSTLIAVFVALVAGELVARFYQTVLTMLLGQRVTKDLRTSLFAKLQEVDVGFLEKNPVGRLMTRVTNDVESISEMFAAGAVSIVGDFVTLAGIIAMMFVLDWKLTLYAFAVLPVLGGVVLFFRPRAREAFREVRTYLARLNGFLNESISGMHLIQVFRQEKEMFSEFSELNAKYRDANVTAIRFDAMTYAIVEGIATVATALVLLLGFGMFAGGAVEIGVFVAFVEYLRRFFAPITELSTKYTMLQSAMASAERCVDLLDERASITSRPDARPLAPLSDAVRFEHVSFAYSAAGQKVLDDLSFTVKRGEKVAIVGPTGAGKSTIVKLIARFYDPTAGRVTFDGVDLRDASLDDVRRKLALVLQDAYLFDGTIEENIAFGAKLDHETLVRAAARTQALSVIEGRPEGWKTMVGERGARFSSGERQLIAFARALALDPELLVLDEATSAVDPETESKIQRGLEALIQDRTAVIIAHRLSTIRRVDRIIVLAAGRVVEEGSHDELLAKGGVYKNLYELQFAEEERDAA